MRAVLLLAVAAGLAATAVPAALARARWCTRRPAVALALWCATWAGGLAAAGAAGVGALAHALAGAGTAGTGTAGTGALCCSPWCWVLCWAGLAATGAALALVLARSEPLAAGHRRTADLLASLAGATAYRHESAGGISVVFVDSDRPLALSLPGPDPRVLVTSRLEDELTGAQLRAVIAHERAHLAGRHGWITLLAQLNAACTPGLPAARQFRRASRLLVELIADDAATHACGGTHLAEALTTLAALEGEQGLLLRARRAAGPSRR